MSQSSLPIPRASTSITTSSLHTINYSQAGCKKKETKKVQHTKTEQSTRWASSQPIIPLSDLVECEFGLPFTTYSWFFILIVPKYQKNSRCSQEKTRPLSNDYLIILHFTIKKGYVTSGTGKYRRKWKRNTSREFPTLQWRRSWLKGN